MTTDPADRRDGDSPTVQVAPERESDREGVHALLTAAFASDDEARLVAAGRRSPAYDGDLALAATVDGDLVGYVLFPRVTVPGTDRPGGHLTLAPVAVRPSRQGEGLGSELVGVGLDRARGRRYGSVLLHGAPAFYRRFGFARAGEFGLENPFDLPDGDFQALELRPGALDGATGEVTYPQPFEAL